jgi:hypothetical protein
MKHDFGFKNTALLMALAAIYPLQAHALAGIAQFTAGEVNVRQTDGRSIALAKGGNIDSGQAIVTGTTGRAQVRFTDGGLISLQPNTEFKIASYVDQNDPKEDRFLVDLLRGSMRAITGLIGKRNRDNYKLTTTTATIGIRGSGFKVGYNADGSLGITSELDKIEVCNQSGCIGLVAGESVRVIDNVSPPVRTSQQAKVETPDTAKDPVVVGDKVNSEGKAEILAAVGAASKEKTFTDLTVLGVVTDSSNNAFNELGTGTGLTSTFEVQGNRLVKVNKSGATSTTWTPASGAIITAGSVGNVDAADFIGWGSWSAATKVEVSGSTTVTPLKYFHYVAGRPTPAGQMPTSGTATYNFVGGTVTRINGGGTTVGSFNVANTNLSVDFGTSSLTANINTSEATFNDTASISGSTFSGLYVKGFFTGAGATRAGLTFLKALTAGDHVTGAIVFTK